MKFKIKELCEVKIDKKMSEKKIDWRDDKCKVENIPFTQMRTIF